MPMNSVYKNKLTNKESFMHEKDNCSRLSKFITWIVLLFMPLSTYAAYVEGITFGDILLILGVLLITTDIFLNKKINLLNIIATPLLLYMIFIIIHSLIFWMIKPYELSEGLLGVSRYLLYLYFAMNGAKYYFNYDYGYKIYKKLAILFALYCIAQYFSYNFFSTVLPVNLFGLPTFDDISAITSKYNISMYQTGAVLYRPRSVFLEPAYFAAYQIPILYLILNNKNEKYLTKYSSAILITASIFLAGTTTGILMQFLCWWKPIITELKKISFKFVNLIIIAIPCVYLFISSDYWQRVSNRIISNDGTLGTSVTGRIQNYKIFFDGRLSWDQLLFGQGKWVSVGYLPSYGELIISFGLVGLVVFSVVMLLTYLKTQKIGKAMTLLLLVMCIGTNTLFNITSVLMFFLIYSDSKSNIRYNFSGKQN
ncbi:hypothetical protein [Tepidanaerobacter acetatoxydans]|uniref:hypothetical protein n=1 Tax=Tepidanaerobacter acetatoxydans TaxID=499229 RepID=UPI00020BF3B3|nr:hypothetical protein [Tepidanaerobacter acetatoxydans]AEE91893.1 hypothetical protein TepRe1_1762 [Tepidanaerobacter acetatoxydans Re1]